MAEGYRTIDCARLRQAWSLLNEYHDFLRMANFRKKLEEQLHDANIPLTNVPWKSMVRAILCQSLFHDENLKEMNANTSECYTENDIISSHETMNLLLENDKNVEENLTETWFEVNELKQRFQKAHDILPKTRCERKEMLHRILGYPIGYSEGETDFDLNRNDDESLDLTRVLTIDEQCQMRTGDLIELSGNRLHDAFYVYRLPEKGIWSQIQQMWSKHQITNFIFNDTEQQREEIILIPAMDEYGYGVPYLFATTSAKLLPSDALYKYVDINCSFISRQTENPTIALVQKHLNDRLKNPVYKDTYIGEEMKVDLDRFPQEYVAMVHIKDAPTDNVVWICCVHYNGKEIAKDLNDNQNIFFSRRILEAEEQNRFKN